MVHVLMPAERQKKKYPTGYVSTAGRTKIAVNFRTETFNRLIAIAKKKGVSFSTVVEQMVNAQLGESP